jgi:hypothetical protein
VVKSVTCVKVIQKCIKVIRNASKSSKMRQNRKMLNAPKSLKRHQSHPKCVSSKMRPSHAKCVKVSKDASKSSKMFQNGEHGVKPIQEVIHLTLFDLTSMGTEQSYLLSTRLMRRCHKRAMEVRAGMRCRIASTLASHSWETRTRVHIQKVKTRNRKKVSFLRPWPRPTQP